MVRRVTFIMRRGEDRSEAVAWASISASDGIVSGVHASSGGGTSLPSGDRSRVATVISLPDAPSMAAWWTLLRTAT
mgnify:CR=1 FL=1